jgi:hypothetical protein
MNSNIVIPDKEDSLRERKHQFKRHLLQREFEKAGFTVKISDKEIKQFLDA